MLLVADIGNSQCHFATFKNGTINWQKNIPTQQFNTELLDALDITEAVLIAVADKPLSELRSYLKTRQIPCHVVGENKDYRLPTADPKLLDNLGAALGAALGADRAMNILGGHHFTSPPFLAIDCGTATTLDYCNEKGEFDGGIILAGINMMARSLHEHTDRLPLLQDITLPPLILGHNTSEAIESGLTYGYACLLNGLVEQIFTAKKQPINVILCGGAAHIIAKSLNFNFILQNDLTLYGGWCYMKKL